MCGGILRIHKLDFARQLTTFRAQGATRVAQMRALAKFNRLFAGELLRIYGVEVAATSAAVTAIASGAGMLAVYARRRVLLAPGLLTPARRALAYAKPRRHPAATPLPRLSSRRRRRRRRALPRALDRLTPTAKPRPASGSEFQLQWGTRLAGGLSVASGTILIAAEIARIWRLGTLPLSRTDSMSGGSSVKRLTPRAAVAILRDGYRVSSTRENTIFNMLASFVVTFGITRGITITIRSKGHLGPISDLSARGRHIHHFIPGAIVSLLAGGVAVGQGHDALDRLMAIPFGTGVALVLDEAALLLELEDVYWTDKGVVSLQAAFAMMALLAAISYAQQVRRRGAPGTEADWLAAAAAWDSLQALGRRPRSPAPDPT